MAQPASVVYVGTLAPHLSSAPERMYDLLVARQPEHPWQLHRVDDEPTAAINELQPGWVCIGADVDAAALCAWLAEHHPDAHVIALADQALENATTLASATLASELPEAPVTVIAERLARIILGDDYLPRLGDPTQPASDDRGHWVFIGDSITDGQRTGDPEGLGSGYVRLLHELIRARRPDLAVRITNRGISGNTITDLATRWDADALDLAPDKLIIYIGINDGNCYLRDATTGTNPQQFVDTYRHLLTSARERLGDDHPIIIICPFFLTPDNPDTATQQVIAGFPEYIDHVRDLANEFDCRFINLPPRLAAHAKQRPLTALAPDSVHPNATGCAVIAEALFDALIGDR